MGQSTKSNGPRHLDRRTREGRTFYKRVGREGFAKARRGWKKKAAKTGKHSPTRTDDASGEAFAALTKKARTTVKTLPKTKPPERLPVDEIDQAIEVCEERLTILRNLKAERERLNKAVDIITEGGTAEEAQAFLRKTETPKN